MSCRRVALHPEAAAEVSDAVGRLPYILINSATDDAVTLLALAHVGRDPRGIERRLAERDQP